MKNGIYFTRAEMEKRIVFRCEKCDAILSLVPCPNGDYGFDHRCQPEKVTPKEGELIEMAALVIGTKGTVDERERISGYATGQRCPGSGWATATQQPNGKRPALIREAWRYPGETYWRD